LDACIIGVTATGIGIFLSAVAAVLPAMQAAKMPAAAALRVEV
jgi:ABC-type lipoprotein release transport system permease subunit